MVLGKNFNPFMVALVPWILYHGMPCVVSSKQCLESLLRLGSSTIGSMGSRVEFSLEIQRFHDICGGMQDKLAKSLQSIET